MLLEASQSSSNNSNPTVAETETDNDTDNAPERGKPEREIQKISLLVSGVGGRGRQPLIYICIIYQGYLYMYIPDIHIHIYI